MSTIASVSVQDLIGVPFKAGGRGPDSYDCWGLVLEVRRRLGLQSPEYVYDLNDVTDAKAINNIMVPATLDARWVPVDASHIGGVVAIRNAGGPFVNHCGVIFAPYTFIHTLLGVGAHVVYTNAPMYRHRIHGVYEWQSKS